ncbi:hypothetical protein EV127DRAFT_107941 [Xylaria flabelliformis]|nr:hypothetical protein EV127DRAFT_107941 [Xylaria flabelliformis]
MQVTGCTKSSRHAKHRHSTAYHCMIGLEFPSCRSIHAMIASIFGILSFLCDPPCRAVNFLPAATFPSNHPTHFTQDYWSRSKVLKTRTRHLQAAAVALGRGTIDIGCMPTKKSHPIVRSLRALYETLKYGPPRNATKWGGFIALTSRLFST